MKKIIDKIKSIDRGTLVRTIVLAIAAINQVVAFIGKTTFASADWYQWLSLVVLIVTAIVAWWENNDITSFAQLGTKIVDALEDGKITTDEVKDILNYEKSEETK